MTNAQDFAGQPMDAAEAGNIDNGVRLAQENAYLRALVSDLRGLAGENLSLLHRIADLEQQLADVGMPVAPIAETSVGAPAAALRDETTTDVKALANRLLSAPQHKQPVLVLGPPTVNHDTWPMLGLAELTDICLGLPEESAICFLCGALSERLDKRHDPLRRAYEAQIIDVATNGGGETWGNFVEQAIEVYAPTLTVVTDLSPGWEAAIDATNRVGSRLALYLSKNEAQHVGSREAALSEAIKADPALLAAADLILVTSLHEQSLIQSVLPDGPDVQIYVRGVDLSKFKSSGRAPGATTNVVLVDDRANAVDIRRYLDVVDRLANVSQIQFSLVTPHHLPPRHNLTIHPPLLRDKRIALYQEADIIVAPEETLGFSQSVMEAMACGCAAIAPDVLSAGYGEPSGFVTRAGDHADIAVLLNQLNQDKEHLAQLCVNAEQFAHTWFARSNWAGWLRSYTQPLVA